MKTDLIGVCDVNICQQTLPSHLACAAVIASQTPVLSSF